MKKIAFALMCVMTVFVLSACSKSGNGDKESEIVGGEDVTNPFLNPGGKIIDKGVNIVGAWAFCGTSTPNMVEDFFIINSKGEITEYLTLSPYEFELDSKGVLHCYHKDYKLGEMGPYPYKGGKTMVEALLSWWSHDPEGECHNLTTHKDEKTGKFGVKYTYYEEAHGSGTVTVDCVLTVRDVDTYNYTSTIYDSNYGEENFKGYLRRIKSLLD